MLDKIRHLITGYRSYDGNTPIEDIVAMEQKRCPRGKELIGITIRDENCKTIQQWKKGENDALETE